MQKINVKRMIVALFLNKYNRSEKVRQGNATVAAITANPAYFPPAECAALVDVLRETSVNLGVADAATASGSHESFTAADIAEMQWDNAIRNCAAYVQQKADANPSAAADIITSAAFKMRKAAAKGGDPIPVKDFNAEVTGLGNAIKLEVVSDNPYGCRYEMMMTATPADATSWVAVANITSRKTMVRNLANGTRYYFKVRVINNQGVTPYCEMISQIAA